MPILTIRLSRTESARVAKLAKRKKVSRSEVVRQGIAALERADEATAFDAWSDAAGIIEGGPTDLATNPRHMARYGR